jgi:hypothetical protein
VAPHEARIAPYAEGELRDLTAYRKWCKRHKKPDMVWPHGLLRQEGVSLRDGKLWQRRHCLGWAIESFGIDGHDFIGVSCRRDLGERLRVCERVRWKLLEHYQSFAWRRYQAVVARIREAGSVTVIEDDAVVTLTASANDAEEATERLDSKTPLERLAIEGGVTDLDLELRATYHRAANGLHDVMRRVSRVNWLFERFLYDYASARDQDRRYYDPVFIMVNNRRYKVGQQASWPNPGDKVLIVPSGPVERARRDTSKVPASLS